MRGLQTKLSGAPTFADIKTRAWLLGKLSALICKMGVCLEKCMGHHAAHYKWKKTVLTSASKGK